MAVNIHGKQYVLVAERVELFHENYSGENTSIVTEIIRDDGEVVVMKATVSVNDQIYTGHAQEVYGSSMINNTSALENCETSAIGRALASAGFGGGEFASADEVANAITQQKNGNNEKPKPAKKEEPVNEKELDWNDSMRDRKLGFGKHSDLAWRDVDNGYLRYLSQSENNSGNDRNKIFATAEIVARASSELSRPTAKSKEKRSDTLLVSIKNLMKRVGEENSKRWIKDKIGDRGIKELSSGEQEKLFSEFSEWAERTIAERTSPIPLETAVKKDLEEHSQADSPELPF